MRVLKITGGALCAVIVVLALLAIVGIPSGWLTSAITARVERDTGYRLTIAGATKIRVWPTLNMTLNDVTLQDPADRDGARRITIAGLQADMTLAGLWSGHPEVTDLVMTGPVLHVPLLRERTDTPAPATHQPAPADHGADATAPSIDRITLRDGAVEFSNLRDRVTYRIDGINAGMKIDADRKVSMTGAASAGGHPLTFALDATAPAVPGERPTIPVALKLEAPGLLQGPLSAKAEVRLNNGLLTINGVSGKLGDGAFNGWASADLSSKPVIKLDLDFQRLDLAAAGAPPSPGLQPWSNATVDLIGLNYVDVQARISAAEINMGDVRFAPAAIDAALAGGVIKARFANLGAYGGQASGDLAIDATATMPAYTLRCDLTGVRALPLLRAAAGFDELDGNLQAKLALRSTGNSQRAILSNLDGTVFTLFRDGAIKGLNVAQMIRALTSGTLTGWQQSQEQGRAQSTDLSQLGASFRIDKGLATTSDLNLVGPLVKMTGAGTVDLGNQTLAFRVEPKLVLTTEGQGRAGDPVGFGIPVIIDGPWAEPRIYPEIAGILEHPDAAYAKLKEMGKGLFGGGQDANGKDTNSNDSGGSLGATIGKLLQQGLDQSRSLPPAPPSGAAPPAPGDPPDSSR
jgi:AsmA protein